MRSVALEWRGAVADPLAAVRTLKLAVTGSCAAFVAGGLAAITVWLLGGSAKWLDIWFKELGGPLLVAYALAEMAGAAWAARWYERGEALRTPWLLLSAAGGIHAASAILRHWLAAPIALNPLLLTEGATRWQPLLEESGRVLGGTLYLLLMVAGLSMALRAHARLKLLRPPSGTDWLVLLAAAFLFTYTLRWLAHWMAPAEVHRTLLWWIGWITDPLLGCLLILSMLLARAAAPLRGGLLARPWRAYLWATALTCVGSLCVGLQNYAAVPPTSIWPAWLLWHPAAALSALAPLLQLDAVRYYITAQRGGAEGLRHDM